MSFRSATHTAFSGAGCLAKNPSTGCPKSARGAIFFGAGFVAGAGFFSGCAFFVRIA